MKNLFLVSSSRYQGGAFWAHCLPALGRFMGKPEEGRNKVIFVPYANVDGDYHNYTETVSKEFKKFGYETKGLHLIDRQTLLGDKTICAIVIGGGNTWFLNDLLQKSHLASPIHLLETIKFKVESGEWKYIGASAGTVTACPSILTTNDMPPVLPKSDLALGLIPFQINPHFISGAIAPKHMSETREERIRQVILCNPTWKVVGLPEACWIEGHGEEYVLWGNGEAVVFRKNDNNSVWLPGEKFEPIGML